MQQQMKREAGGVSLGIKLLTALVLTGFVAACAPPPVPPAATEDTDGDGHLDVADNCPTISNPDQADVDADGMGAACDTVGDNDFDNDTVVDGIDTCPALVDATNNVNNCTDSDSDGTMNASDACPNDNRTTTDTVYCTDTDSDTVVDFDDVCPSDAGTSSDTSYCTDTDGDLVFDHYDNCPALNGAQDDFDSDGQGDICDGDKDGDGIANASDIKSGSSPVIDCSMNPAPACNAPAITCNDADADGVTEVTAGATGCQADNCPTRQNASQNLAVCTDTDSDGVYDLKADNEAASATDNCPSRKNASQNLAVCTDTDSDGDYDASADGTTDGDNCVSVANANQANFDGDANGGDACDLNADNDTMLGTEEWPGCDVNNTTDAAGFLTCGTHMETSVAAAWLEWYAQIPCHRTNDGACDANPNGTGTFGFNCNRTGGSGSVTWAISASDATQTWNACRYISENGTSPAMTKVGGGASVGVAGYDLTVSGALGGAPDGTAGTIYPKGTVTVVVNGGVTGFATSGAFTATIYDKRDVHAKVPVVNHAGTGTSSPETYVNDLGTDNHSNYVVISCPKAVKGCDGLFHRRNAKTIATHTYSGNQATGSWEAVETKNTAQSP